MEVAIFLIVGIAVGVILGFLIGKAKGKSELQNLMEEASIKYNALDKEFAAYKASSFGDIENLRNDVTDLNVELVDSESKNEEAQEELRRLENSLATATADLSAANKTIREKEESFTDLKNDYKKLEKSYSETSADLATYKANNKASGRQVICPKRRNIRSKRGVQKRVQVNCESITGG